MTKPKVLDGDTVREMTKAELTQHELDQTEWAKIAATVDQLAAARASALAKLVKLGLTATELNELFGMDKNAQPHTKDK